jgi:CRP/FNR family cyclic AMP-dependent transcriptional regulator
MIPVNRTSNVEEVGRVTALWPFRTLVLIAWIGCRPWVAGRMDVGKIAALLADVELFNGLEHRTRHEIAAAGRHRLLRKGESIFIQDQPGTSCFVLLEGTVKLYLLSDDGRRAELVRHSTPTVFGEIAVLDGGPRSASAEVVEDARLIELHRDELLRIVRSDPAALDALLRSLGSMVRRTTRQVTDLVFLDLRGRVARYLLGLAEERGITTGPVKHVNQGELATIVGGARQSVNIALKSLERSGGIRVRGGNVEIVDRAKLRELSTA